MGEGIEVEVITRAQYKELLNRMSECNRLFSNAERIASELTNKITKDFEVLRCEITDFAVNKMQTPEFMYICSPQWKAVSEKIEGKVEEMYESLYEELDELRSLVETKID